MFTIEGLDKNNSDGKYHTAGFKRNMEDFIPKLMNSDKTRTVTLEYAVTKKWTGDFFGLMKELKLDYNYRWIAMRINGLHSPSDWDGEELTVLVPATTEIDAILAKYLTTESGV